MTFIKVCALTLKTWKLNSILYLFEKYITNRFSGLLPCQTQTYTEKDVYVSVPHLPFLNLFQSNFYLLPNRIQTSLDDVTNELQVAEYSG